MTSSPSKPAAPIPPAPPYRLTATQALAAFRSRARSPVELVEALLARIDQHDGSVQAWQTVDREGALAAARRAEAEWARGTGGALCGVPVGVKDIFAVAGLPNTANFAPFTDNVPTEDAGAVARLRAAGAVVLGKTVTAQFAYGNDSPQTRNPWHLERTPGGSSSGSGAAVGARMVPVALGTQTGGSNLRPAAYCGVVGLKPSFGRVTRHGLLPVSWSLDHPGIIVRSVEDAALVLSVIAGHDPRDPHTTRAPLGDLRRAATERGGPPTLGLVRDLLDAAQPNVRANAELAAGRLEEAGARVHEVRLPGGLPALLAVHYLLISCEPAAGHAWLYGRYTTAYANGIRRNLEIGTLLPAAAYLHARRLRRAHQAQLEALLTGVEALLAPTVSTIALDRRNTGDASFQSVVTLFGLPNITLPSGLSADGLPHGVQLIARRYAEEQLVRVARWCEDVFGPAPEPPLDGLEAR